MSIDDPREYARQCKIDKYEERMDKEIKRVGLFLWMNNIEDYTEEDCLYISDLEYKYNFDIEVLDMKQFKTTENLIDNLDSMF